MYKKNLIKTATLALLIATATAGCGKEEVISTLDTVQEVVESVEEKEAKTSVEEVSLPEISVEAEPEIEVEETKIASNGMPEPVIPKTIDECPQYVQDEIANLPSFGYTESEIKEREKYEIKNEERRIGIVKEIQALSPEEINSKDVPWFNSNYIVLDAYKEYFTKEQYEALKPLCDRVDELVEEMKSIYEQDVPDMERLKEIDKELGVW